MDGTRLTSSACNQLSCPTRSDTSDPYNTFEGTDPTQISKWTACKLKDRVMSTHRTTLDNVPNNLCSQKPSRPYACPGSQGSLGTWTGSTVRSLYAYLPLAPTPTTLLTLAAAKPPSTQSLMSLTLAKWDIGGHYIRLALNNAKTLWVSGLPLRSHATLSAATQSNATDWVNHWVTNRYLETNTLANNHNPATTSSSSLCTTWACPLKRRYFHSGASATFRPWVPDPRRTMAAYNTTNHPTTPPSPIPDSVLAKYYTRDGMCVCSDPADCLAAYAASSGLCSRLDSITALYDQTQRLSRVLGSSPCPSQTDWPWTGAPNLLHDGSYLPSQISTPCGVLDRLPPFRYRYVNAKKTIPAPPTLTTFSEGGDCHMGRAARHTESIPSECLLTDKNSTHMTLDCNGVPMYLPRPSSPTVQVQLAAQSRTRCGDCDAPPSFFANGAPTAEPEISYGTPYRVATSRLLARDLRFRLCCNDTNCPAVDSQGWAMGSFWSRMADNTLFSGDATASSSLNADFNEPGPDPADAAWDEPWLLCTKASSASAPECKGTISKLDWQTSADRPKMCQAIKDQSNAADATVDLTICNLDSRLNDLCTLIQNARYRVFEANCQITGQCRTSAFFYQPATYSSSDERFVRSTVANFYNFTQANSCPILDVETMDIIASNQRTLQNCPAQDLQALKYGIQLAREMLHFFVKICYYMSIIGIDIITLVTGNNAEAVMHDIMYYFREIVAEFGSFFQTIGDVIYKLVMESGKLGAALKAIIMGMCEFLRDIFFGFIQPFICGLREQISMVFDIISGIISFVKTISFNSIDGVSDQINAARDSMRDAIDCDGPNPFRCDSLFPDDENLPSALPMPTRCWVGYQPSIGEQQGLGCTPSDTCMDDDGSLVACASCAGAVSPYYGCDSLTKICR